MGLNEHGVTLRRLILWTADVWRTEVYGGSNGSTARTRREKEWGTSRFGGGCNDAARWQGWMDLAAVWSRQSQWLDAGIEVFDIGRAVVPGEQQQQAGTDKVRKHVVSRSGAERAASVLRTTTGMRRRSGCRTLSTPTSLAPSLVVSFERGTLDGGPVSGRPVRSLSWMNCSDVVAGSWPVVILKEQLGVARRRRPGHAARELEDCSSHDSSAPCGGQSQIVDQHSVHCRCVHRVRGNLSYAPRLYETLPTLPTLPTLSSSARLDGSSRAASLPARPGSGHRACVPFHPPPFSTQPLLDACSGERREGEWWSTRTERLPSVSTPAA